MFLHPSASVLCSVSDPNLILTCALVLCYCDLRFVLQAEPAGPLAVLVAKPEHHFFILNARPLRSEMNRDLFICVKYRPVQLWQCVCFQRFGNFIAIRIQDV